MDAIEPPSLGPAGGIITLVVVFLLRELVSGALKKIGKDAWGWVKARRTPGQAKPFDAGSGEPQLRVVRLRRHRASHPEDEAA
jgi:hypothetical protein